MQHTLNAYLQKAQRYCAYQERCQKEVEQKLIQLETPSHYIDEILVKLISDNFLNEERFARAFARGKHYQLHWGTVRITQELQFRNISPYLIKQALTEIDPEHYEQTFQKLAENYWNTLTEKSVVKKQRKFCDFLLRKGYESSQVYEQYKKMKGN